MKKIIKKLLLVGIIFYTSLNVVNAEEKMLYTTNGSPIKRFLLDEFTVYTIVVPERRGVCTVIFPSQLSGLYGSNIITGQDTEQRGDFLISHKPGSYYFSIVSLKDGGNGSLNVVLNRKVYVIRLITDKIDKAYSSVTFDNATTLANKKNIAPKVLLSLLEKAKNYPLYLKHYPESVSGVEYYYPNQIYNYNAYNIKLAGVYRFSGADTLVFHIILKNLTNSELRYNPQDFAVRAGDSGLFFCSVADASGVIPPHGQTKAFFAITGNPNGGKNNLSAENEWKILIQANKTQEPSLHKYTARNDLRDRQMELYGRAEAINIKLSTENISEPEYDRLQKEAEMLISEYNKITNKVKKIANKNEMQDKTQLWTGSAYIAKPKGYLQ